MVLESSTVEICAASLLGVDLVAARQARSITLHTDAKVLEHGRSATRAFSARTRSTR